MPSMKPSSANTRSEAGCAAEACPVKLQPLALRLTRRPGPLLAQIEAALRLHGRPLRWAITAVEPGERGAELLLEAVVEVQGQEVPQGVLLASGLEGPG
jgi:hypothetical protein